MPIESASFVSQLNVANPLATDPIKDGDNHLRLIKSVLTNTFPNMSAQVTATPADLNKLTGLATTATELGRVAGVTSPIQTQLNSLSAAVSALQGITITAGAGLTGGGSLAANRTLALTGQGLALHNLNTNGLIARTGAGTVTGRSLAVGSAMQITNPDGVAGNPTINLIFASQGEAEAGTSSVRVMTPQRVAQAIAALAPVDFKPDYVGSGGVTSASPLTFTGLAGYGMLMISTNVGSSNSGTITLSVAFSTNNGSTFGSNQTVYSISTQVTDRRIYFFDLSRLQFNGGTSISIPSGTNAMRFSVTAGGGGDLQLIALGGR